MASARFNPDIKEALQESHQHNLDNEAVTEATRILADYCETFKAFPEKFDSHTVAIKNCTNALNNGLRLTPEFEAKLRESFKTVIKESKDELNEALLKEKKSFVDDVTKLHKVELEKTKKEHSELTVDINSAVIRLRHELNKDSHCISVPLAILIIIGIVVFFLTLHYGMAILALCLHLPIECLTKLTVVTLVMIILLPALIIYLHRQDWL